LISRRDYIFTIGYEGNAAVVDGALKKRYGSLSTEQLAEQQLFKQAVCSAVYERTSGSSQNSGNEGDKALERVLEIYNSKNERKIGSVEELQRLFGVYEVPEGIAKITVV